MHCGRRGEDVKWKTYPEYLEGGELSMPIPLSYLSSSRQGGSGEQQRSLSGRSDADVMPDRAAHGQNPDANLTWTLMIPCCNPLASQFKKLILTRYWNGNHPTKFWPWRGAHVMNCA